MSDDGTLHLDREIRVPTSISEQAQAALRAAVPVVHATLANPVPSPTRREPRTRWLSTETWSPARAPNSDSSDIFSSIAVAVRSDSRSLPRAPSLFDPVGGTVSAPLPSPEPR